MPDLNGPLHIEILPRTIADAIKVTRALGLNFLWVDRICIQSSDTYRTQQILQMHKIFEKSYLTIVAASNFNLVLERRSGFPSWSWLGWKYCHLDSSTALESPQYPDLSLHVELEMGQVTPWHDFVRSGEKPSQYLHITGPAASFRITAWYDAEVVGGICKWRTYSLPLTFRSWHRWSSLEQRKDRKFFIDRRVGIVIRSVGGASERHSAKNAAPSYYFLALEPTKGGHEVAGIAEVTHVKPKATIADNLVDLLPRRTFRIG